MNGPIRTARENPIGLSSREPDAMFCRGTRRSPPLVTPAVVADYH
jgi:hypothetical protein